MFSVICPDAVYEFMSIYSIVDPAVAELFAVTQFSGYKNFKG